MTTDQTPAPAAGSAPATLNMADYSDDWADQSITLRPHLSYAADQRIETARVRMSTEVSSGGNKRTTDKQMEMTAAVTPLEYAVAVVEECVLSWTLLGYSGVTLPASRVGVMSEQAPAELLDVAVDAIVEFYEARRPKLKPRSKRSG